LTDAMAEYAATARDNLPQHSSALHFLGVDALVEQALDALPELSASGPTGSLLHGDFNPGNILRSSSGWVVIDPKPLVGDPAFDLWPLVTQIGAPLTTTDPVSKVRDQLITAARAAECDWHRTARWAELRTALNVVWHLTSKETDLAAAEAFALTVWSQIVRG
jgi:streptomycin 6-kinase